MLLDNIIQYCDICYNEHSWGEDFCNCGSSCSHPSQCPQKCETCLEQVHFPDKYDLGRLDYDCDNILNFYVCKYIYKYSSEIEYALNSIDKLLDMNNLAILSLGCGCSPDLVALENFMTKNQLDIPVSYFGIDINDRWRPINKVASDYFEGSHIKVKYLYEDALDFFKKYYIDGMNILILQYLISHFYNTGKLPEVKKFYMWIIKNVIAHMQEESIIIINDVNSNNRGRDLFLIFSELLTQQGIKHKCIKRYFNYNIKNVQQQYGIMYPSNNILTWPTRDLAQYHPWVVCSSAQLIIELGVG